VGRGASAGDEGGRARPDADGANGANGTAQAAEGGEREMRERESSPLRVGRARERAKGVAGTATSTRAPQV